MAKSARKSRKAAGVFESGFLDTRANHLQSILSRAGVVIPKETTEPPRPSFADVLRAHDADMVKQRAAHRKERIARDLAPNAGAGTPEPAAFIYKIPFSELEKISSTRRSYINERDLKQCLPLLPLGDSRLGGWPDVPARQAWPRYEGRRMPFVAQLNLSQLPKHVHRLLPKDGHLFVFALVDNKDRAKVPVSVFLHRGTAQDLVRPKRISAKQIWPDWKGQAVYRLVPVGASPRHRGVKRIPGGSHDSAGWLFGQMEGVFGSPEEIADELFADGNDWINLLAIESVGSMQWSDIGHFHLLIRKSDLRRLDFSKVLAAVRST